MSRETIPENHLDLDDDQIRSGWEQGIQITARLLLTQVNTCCKTKKGHP